MSTAYNKRPHDVLDYVVDFTRWLSDGDTIKAATSLIGTVGTTIAITSTSHTSTTATVWISGGADGQTAEVVVRVETMLGRTKEACFKIRVMEEC